MIVLATHTLAWWINVDNLLSKKAKAVINRELEGGQVVLSAISAWEIAMLLKQEKLVLSMDVETWIETVAEIEAIHFMPVDAEIAVKLVELPGKFHKDSADRMIVAAVRKLAAPLITRDNKIRSYSHVKTIWKFIRIVKKVLVS